MRNLLIFGFLFFVFTLVPAEAQEFSRINLSGGYSWTNFYDSYHGWNASIAYNLSKNLGVEADVSGHYGNATLYNTYSRNYHTFMGGPIFSTRLPKLKHSIFSHLLLGALREHSQNQLSRTGYLNTSSSHFGLAIGGGLDLRFGGSISLRALQADYFPIPTNNTLLTSGTYLRGRVRLSAGIVFNLDKH
jgi:hypothetical protein